MNKIKVLLAATLFAVIPLVAADAETDKFNAAYAAFNAALDKGDATAALGYAKEAYETGLTAFGSTDGNVKVLAENYTTLLVQAGDDKKAIKVYQDLIKKIESVQGTRGKALVPVLANLTKITAKTDSEAAKKYQKRYYKLFFRHESDKIAKSKREKPLTVPTKQISALEAEAAGIIDEPFTSYEGEHWVIIHPKGKVEGAKVVSEQLEKSYTSFRSFYIALNLGLQPLKQKLVAFMFSSQTDYLIYLKAKNLSTRMRGSYHENVKLLLFFDVPNRRGERTYFTRMNVLAEEGFQQFGVAAGFLPAEKRLFPRWLYDGLSYSFEFNKIEEPFGPNKNNLSSRNWGLAQDMIDSQQWLPLRDLLRIEPNDEYSQKNKTIIYIMGTYFVRFMYDQKPDEMIKYIKILLKGDLKNQTSKQRVRDFKRAFGDIEKVNKEFRRYLDRKEGLSF